MAGTEPNPTMLESRPLTDAGWGKSPDSGSLRMAPLTSCVTLWQLTILDWTRRGVKIPLHSEEIRFGFMHLNAHLALRRHGQVTAG